MRLRNTGETMVLSQGSPISFEIRSYEENRNAVSEPHDNNPLSNGLTESHDNRQSLVLGSEINIAANLNNNVEEHSAPTEVRERAFSESSSISSHDDCIDNSEGRSSSSSVDIFPQGDEYQCFSQEDDTDSEFSDDGNCQKEDSVELISSFSNPNYPDFTEAEDSNGNNTDRVNHLDSEHHYQKDFYDKPKFENCSEIVHDLNIVSEIRELNLVTGSVDASHENVFPEINFVISSTHHKFEFSPKESYQDSGVCSAVTTDGEVDNYESTFLVETSIFPTSGVFETAVLPEDSDVSPSPSEETKNIDNMPTNMDDKASSNLDVEVCKLAKDSENEKIMVEGERMKDAALKCDSDVPRGKMARLTQTLVKPQLSESVLPQGQQMPINRGDEKLSRTARIEECITKRNTPKFRGYMGGRRNFCPEKKVGHDQGMFDVYNIETAMPNFDLDAIESHLKAAKDEEQRNFLTSIKVHSIKVAESLWKERVNNNVSEVKKSDTTSPVSVELNPLANTPSSINSNARAVDLKWPVLFNNEMHWLPSVPHDEEREDVIDRFDSISNVRPNERRRNDREEIRRRLAMGPENDDLYCSQRSGRKPSLQSRLQNGMNLQICFMNDTGSDSESPSESTDSIPTSLENVRPDSLPLKNIHSGGSYGPRPSPARLSLPLKKETELRTEADLLACQARLQSDARHALMQAKEMARMQMEVERQRMVLSPITQMVRTSLIKVGVPFPENRRRLSRQILTEMNVAQLQVIINDLHSQIEVLNENLVEYLMMRDDLHMEQDSMLVDIEDLTRYIGAKEAHETRPVNGNGPSRGASSVNLSLHKAS